MQDAATDLVDVLVTAVQRIGFLMSEGVSRRHLDAVPIGRIERGDIPEMGVVGGRTRSSMSCLFWSSSARKISGMTDAVPYDVSNLKPPQVGKS